MATPIKQLDLQQQFIKVNRDFALKALLALAGMVAGVAAILFLSPIWGAVGVGFILLSAYSLYHMIDKYYASKYYLAQATNAIN